MNIHNIFNRTKTIVTPQTSPASTRSSSLPIGTASSALATSMDDCNRQIRQTKDVVEIFQVLCLHAPLVLHLKYYGPARGRHSWIFLHPKTNLVRELYTHHSQPIAVTVEHRPSQLYLQRLVHFPLNHLIFHVTFAKY